MFTPKKGTKACNLNFTKILRISLLIFLRKSCTLRRPQKKGGDMEMNHNTGILLPDLDDLIYGRENYVSER